MLDNRESLASGPLQTTKRASHYAARQPILTADEKVYGYELLFRSNEENRFYCSNADDATRSVIDMSSLLGLDVLCDERMAFLNCTREILLSEYVTLLPSRNVVLEVLPEVTPDEDVRMALQRLKEAGYKIALDDFVLGDAREELVDFADFLKVDLRKTPMEQAARLTAGRGHICKMVAQKVETREEYAQARRAGFHLFQGYFFRRPQMVRTWSGPQGRSASLTLLREVSKAELNWDEVESAIRLDPTLCYRLLRYLNSPIFGFRSEIRTVHQALMILGENEARRWCRLAVTLDMTKNRTTDLMLAALTRARLSELLGEDVEHGDVDLFLLGLLSLMDSILDIPMKQAVEALHLDHDVQAALLGEECSLSALYQLVLALEAGEWEEVARLCQRLGLNEDVVTEKHWRAMQWAHDVGAMDAAA
ncbi:MAG TPA: HDOD domain-containing protein [Terracidiphilus sp.]|nr:HDOD domain-containing protein [Terracidiphilus sp.]